ncbi:hypothetical protein FE391_08315 [Nonomuraea sp. KC401]|uniref:hypothetical protein n=1 Tax=unclassified Nonomuraea TaxID=2593643 RepID=UPI0010FCFC94|nr:MULTISPECIES: hypothetical protein [unclassified Nonomuraea]NBE93945.1 hypothetical protein [Nonomuraea sp. K271]TLF80201.1 hypothetical protein FE391_08315 [Nonomuraea sp. KC401]
MYYRIGSSGLEWGEGLAAVAGDAGIPAPESWELLASVHGGVAAPDDALGVPGVQRLTVGTVVRVDAAGVRVERQPPRLPGPERDLIDLIGSALPAGEFGIAYSGGLASAFLAVAAYRAGKRPLLVYADLGAAFAHLPLPEVPGLELRRVPMDVSGLLDHHPISTQSPRPLMLEVEVRRRMLAQLSSAVDLPLASGALLEDLVSVRLAETEISDEKLLECEPFHVAGRLPTLAEARKLLEERTVYAPMASAQGPPGAQRQGAQPPQVPTGVNFVPGLTEAGREEYGIAQQLRLPLWKAHIDSLPPVLGKADAALAERGDAGAVLPALDPRVLAAVAALSADDIGRIERGMFRNSLPLWQAIGAHRVTGVRRSPAGYWLRLAAAEHLYAHRDKLAAYVCDSPLADAGLIEAEQVAAALRDPRRMSEHALALLRLVWTDHWMRGQA